MCQRYPAPHPLGVWWVLPVGPRTPRRMNLTRRRSPVALCAVFALLVAAATAFGHPAGKTTLEETALPGAGDFKPLVAGKGERFVVLSGLGAKPRKGRARARRSLVYFGQLTDP